MVYDVVAPPKVMVGSDEVPAGDEYGLIICSRFSPRMSTKVSAFTLAQPTTPYAEAMRRIVYGSNSL